MNAKEKLWQGCGKNPDITTRTDTIDEFALSYINKLRTLSTGQDYPAYRLIRQIFLVFSSLQNLIARL